MCDAYVCESHGNSIGGRSIVESETLRDMSLRAWHKCNTNVLHTHTHICFMRISGRQMRNFQRGGKLVAMRDIIRLDPVLSSVLSPYISKPRECSPSETQAYRGAYMKIC